MTHIVQRAARLLAALSCILSMCATASPLRLGISEFADFSINEPIINATVTHLTHALGEENFTAKVYSVSDLQNAIRQSQVDVVLSSTGLYRRMVIEKTGLRDIATVVSERAPDPNLADGSVFFTLPDRNDLNSVADLFGKSVAANHQYGFSGWHIALGEIRARGFDPDNFFGSIDFKGHRMPLVIDAVLRREVDAGIVRACFLEDLDLDISRFKIIGEKKGDILCRHSTDLYPNWTFSATPSVTPEMSRRITVALLSMTPLANDVHWSIATDFRKVDKLFFDLRVGPYEYLRTFSWRRFAEEHVTALALLFCFITMLLFHSVRVGWLVKKRTAELEESLAREKQFERESHEAQERFAYLQRAGIVGQMSSIIAHELRQPLASISMYCYGLRRRIENRTMTDEVARASLEKIAAQTDRATGIVDQVRTYARGTRERSAQNLALVAENAVANIRKSSKSRGVLISLSADDTAWVDGNALELELILMNLIKNAIEAIASVPAPKVYITISRDESFVWARVRDNGPYIEDAQWEAIQKTSAKTTKDAGLGLGLSIVRSIVEDLGGRLFFERPTTGGLIVSIRLRNLESDRDS